MSERWYERHGALYEVFDCESGRIYGRVWADQLRFNMMPFQYDKMGLNTMIRLVQP